MTKTEPHRTTSPAGMTAIGLVLLCGGLLANPWCVGKIFVPSGSIASAAWIAFILLFDILLVSSGLLIWINRRTVTLRKLFLGFLVVVVTISAIEAGLRIESRLFYHHKYMITEDRQKLSFFRDKPWTPELFKEFSEFRLAVDTYSGWKAEEYHGQHLNVDKSGSRRTYFNPESPADTILFLGASSMWGDHVRDSATIASLTGRTLSAIGGSHYVVNQAQTAFSFEQSIIQLAALLRNGMRPRVVVVYGGINDVTSAVFYDSVGVVGLSEQLGDLLRLQRLSYWKQIGRATRVFIEHNSMIFTLFDRTAARLRPPRGAYGMQRLDAPEISRLSKLLAEDFHKSFDLAQGLSATYNFKLVCVLQPTIFTRQTRTEEEKTVDMMEDELSVGELQRQSYAGIDSLRLPEVYDFSDALNSFRGSAYLDFCHISEEGNGVIAEKMSRLLQDILSRNN